MAAAAELSVAALNELLSCSLCHGYYRDAHTVTECMHTFCKSCILLYFHRNNTRGAIHCPTCETNLGIMKHIDTKIKFDRDVQAIVDKIFPHFAEQEKEQEIKFYQERGIAYRAEMNKRGGRRGNDEEEEDKEEAPNSKRPKKALAQHGGRHREVVDNYVDEDAEGGDDGSLNEEEVEYQFKLVPCSDCDISLQLPMVQKRFRAVLSTRLIKVQKFIHKRINDMTDSPSSLSLRSSDIEILFNNEPILSGTLSDYESKFEQYIEENRGGHSSRVANSVELSYRRRSSSD